MLLSRAWLSDSANALPSSPGSKHRTVRGRRRNSGAALPNLSIHLVWYHTCRCYRELTRDDQRCTWSFGRFFSRRPVLCHSLLSTSCGQCVFLLMHNFVCMKTEYFCVFDAVPPEKALSEQVAAGHASPFAFLLCFALFFVVWSLSEDPFVQEIDRLSSFLRAPCVSSDKDQSKDAAQTAANFPSVLALPTTDSVIVALHVIASPGVPVRLLVIQRNGTFLVWEWNNNKDYKWAYKARGVLPYPGSSTGLSKAYARLFSLGNCIIVCV